MSPMSPMSPMSTSVAQASSASAKISSLSFVILSFPNKLNSVFIPKLFSLSFSTAQTLRLILPLKFPKSIVYTSKLYAKSFKSKVPTIIESFHPLILHALMNTFFHCHTQSVLLVSCIPSCEFQTLVSNRSDTFIDTQILLNRSLHSTHRIHYAPFRITFSTWSAPGTLARISPLAEHIEPLLCALLLPC